VPYLHLPDDMEIRSFPAEARLRVGLAWAGRDTTAPVPLRQLLRLAAQPGARLISLQRGPRAADLEATGALAFMDNAGAGCRDLADVAGVISGLDLVVATDSVEAHIAGAMGKPVWVLLPLGNDWRWVDSRDDSVWYPTMRVFRQAQDGSWDRAIARIADGLAAMAAGKR
jgi:ADP-heptose:LPS heptosyltransferase